VELLAPGVTKGAALRRLAEREGISMEDVAAIGDGRNDLEMLAAAGRSAAVASAHPEVRAVAQLVVPSNGEEGALAALRMWFPWLTEAVGPPELSIA
jgi:hydroxymethylpyrimidine pyrophosphatase-like HAD family hydrolase